jgi:maltose O-acetyltransferase
MINGEKYKMAKVGTINRLKYYWNRARLKLNSDYYTEYLKKLGVQIGKDSTVLYPAYVDGRWPYLLEIGNNVVISINSTILTHDASTSYAGDMVKVGKVVVHDRCFIGANCTILCNVSIGPGSIVGAGSVISRNVPPDTVYAGNPARYICTVTEFVEKHRRSGKSMPFFKGSDFEHAFIEDKQKINLRKSLQDTFGYVCYQLPNKNIEQ